jgi:hypothetical protein
MNPAPDPLQSSVPCHSEPSAAKSKNLLLVILSQGWETSALNPAVHEERIQASALLAAETLNALKGHDFSRAANS